MQTISDFRSTAMLSTGRCLPADCALLPISSGGLLVSPGHAVFCRVPREELESVRAAMADHGGTAGFSTALLAELDRHGFFGQPRLPKADVPSVQLQLTNACPLSCRYCCTNSGTRRADEVCYEMMREVVRQIPEVMGTDAGVAILGGEPLLVPWAPDLAEDVLAQHLDLTLFTNGLPLAEPSVADRVAALSRRGAKVRISLAGPSRGSCDDLSGTERFEAALAGVRNLADRGGHAALDLMLAPQYVKETAEELPRLRERLPEGFTIALGLLYLSGRETGDHIFNRRAELETALDRIAFESGVAIAATHVSPLAERREGCACALGNHVHVRSDGALFNCFKMEEKVGELATNGFAHAAREIREHPHRSPALETCRACPLSTLCGAGCRSENLLYTGDADKPPCGPWRVRVMSELLAEDRVTAVEWPLALLLGEARARGIETPELVPMKQSRHLLE